MFKEALKPKNLLVLLIGVVALNGIISLIGNFFPVVPQFTANPVGTIRGLFGNRTA